MSTVGKLVVLKLDGDFEQSGFHVALEIGPEQSRPSIEVPGKLPPNPELVETLNEWRQTYRSLGMLSRISPQKIIYGGSVNRQKECQRLADDLRDRLNDWLESKSFQSIDRQLREELDRDEPIRVLIRTHNKELRCLPWHLWDFIERYPKAEIALSASRFEPISAAKTNALKGKVKILAILGNSNGINVEHDRSSLEGLPDAAVTFLSEPKRHEINDHLWDQPWDILFFAGHSQTEEDKGRIYINAHESLTLNELRYGLRQAIDQGLQLAIFNSCDGLGLAYELEQLHLPQLIVMREPVPDLVAQKFVKYFLNAFSGGDSLYLAERKARQRLHGLESDFPCASWLPVIWQNPAEAPPTWGALRGEIALAPPVQLPQAHTISRETLPLRIVFLVGLAMTSLVMCGRWQGHLQPWELKAYDQMMRLQPPLEQSDHRLLVVRITQDDIDRLQQPLEETGRGAQTLSDRNLEKLLNILESYKPLAIGLDLFRGGKVDGKLYPKLKASLRSGRVVAGCFGRTPQYTKTVAAPDDIPNDSIGFLLAPFEHDDVIRRYSLWQTIDDPAYPCRVKQLGSFGFNLALKYLQTKGITRQDGPDDPFIKVGNTGFEELKLHRGGYHKSDSGVDGGMQFILNYRPYRNYTTDISPTVTLTDVLNNHLNLKDVDGRIVLIGVDISEDRYKTPYTHNETQPSELLPGVLYHAQAISYLMDVVQGKRSMIWTLPWWLDSLWVLTWALVGGIVVRYVSLRKRFTKQLLLKLILPSSIAFGTLYGLCLMIFFWSGGWLPLIPSFLAFSITGGGLITYRVLHSQRNT